MVDWGGVGEKIEKLLRTLASYYWYNYDRMLSAEDSKLLTMMRDERTTVTQ